MGLSFSVTSWNDTAANTKIDGLTYTADYYYQFDVEVWRGSTYERTVTWTDSSTTNHYTTKYISGLSDSTTYTFKGFVWSTSSNRVHAGTQTFTTDPTPDTTDPYVNITSVNTGQNNITMYWDASDSGSGLDHFEMYISSAGGGAYTNIDTYESPSTRSYTYTTDADGLAIQPDTEYNLQIKAVDNAGNYSLDSVSLVRTDEPDPSPITGLIVTSKTDTAVSMDWDASSYASKYYMNYKLAGASAWSSGGTTTSSYGTVSGLEVGTAYDFKVYAQNSDGYNGDPAYLYNVSTTGGRPDDWVWGVVFSPDDPSTKLTASKWNGFTQRINDFRVYKDLATVTFASLSVDDALTATEYNKARDAIADMSPPTAPPATGIAKETPLTAANLDLFRDSLNSIQ